jgi:hypothetical protein
LKPGKTNNKASPKVKGRTAKIKKAALSGSTAHGEEDEASNEADYDENGIESTRQEWKRRAEGTYDPT